MSKIFNIQDRFNRISEDATQTARKIRAELKAEFPGIKFSVTTCKRGGSSVSIHWIDGPTKTAVEAIVGMFESASFDGMTDSEDYHGYIQDGNLIRGAKYIFCTRHLSESYKFRLVNILKFRLVEPCFIDGEYGLLQLEEAEALLSEAI